ncbi:MAG: hypothetical protein IT449_14710 [Phycisphaerales bacterium]|nr:hypothetical protein [Phycisphaerales bacterium]
MGRVAPARAGVLSALKNRWIRASSQAADWIPALAAMTSADLQHGLPEVGRGCREWIAEGMGKALTPTG